jgi:hypothetical protein
MKLSYRTKPVPRKPVLRFLVTLFLAIVVFAVIRGVLLYFGINPLHILDGDW